MKVLDCSTPIKYTSKEEKKEKVMVQAILADATGYNKALVYDENRFPLVKKDEVIISNDFIKKEDK